MAAQRGSAGGAGGWLGRLPVRALGLSAILLLVSAATFDPKLYINGDNVEYMRLAQGLLAGGPLWASPKFPPFFPMLLAPVQALFGLALAPQKILIVLLYAASGGLLLPLAERLLPRGLAFVGVLAGMIAIPVLEFSHYVMTEIPYLALSLGALVVGERLLAGPAPRRFWPPPRALVLFFGLAAAAFYTRTAGAVVAGAFLGVSLLPGRRRFLPAGIALTALVLLPWVIHALRPGASGQTYLDQVGRVNPYFPEEPPLAWGSLLSRLSANGARYFHYELPRALVPFVYGSTYTPRLGPRVPVSWALALPLVALITAGVARAARRLPLTAAVWGLTLVVLLLWPPIWAGVRFLVPILPLTTLFLLVGLGEPLRLAPRTGRGRPAELATAVALVLLLALGARNLHRYDVEKRAYPPPWSVYFEAVEWAGRHLPQHSLVIDRKPGLFTFVSGLPSVSFPREADPDRMIGYFRDRGARYVHAATIPYDDIPRFLYPAIMRRPTYFEPVWGTMAPDSSWSLILEFRPAGDARGLTLPGPVPLPEAP
jgi:hypothetical protein